MLPFGFLTPCYFTLNYVMLDDEPSSGGGGKGEGWMGRRVNA